MPSAIPSIFLFAIYDIMTRVDPRDPLNKKRMVKGTDIAYHHFGGFFVFKGSLSRMNTFLKRLAVLSL